MVPIPRFMPKVKLVLLVPAPLPQFCCCGCFTAYDQEHDHEENCFDAYFAFGRRQYQLRRKSFRICPWQIELSMQQRAGPVKDLKLLWFLERLFPGDSKVVSTLLL